MSLLAQLVMNGVIAGAIYALLASAFSLVFNVAKFVDLTPAAVYIFAAFTAYALAAAGLPLWLAVVVSLAASALLGVAAYKLVFNPLRRRGGQNFPLLIASLGIFFLVDAALLAVFGGNVRTFELPSMQGIAIAGAVITPIQAVIVVVSLLVFGALQFFLHRTKTGKALRAVADDKDVAATLGISVEKSMMITFALSGLLAGTAGILVGMEQVVDRGLGLPAILKAVTASIVGGIGSVPAAVLGSFIIGLAENVALIALPSGFKNAIAFLILVIFLLWRPTGLFGVATREEAGG
jgi:branched-subunit amino acid ABC-type transport system permease component